MPQLDQSVFLNHALFVYLFTSSLTIFFIRWVLPRLLITFRTRQYLLNYQHPMVNNIHAMSQWATKRHWIATMCNWRNIRIYAKYDLHQLYNLQSVLNALYHPYWKNVSLVSYLSDNVIGARLYAPRMAHFLYLLRNNPVKATRKFRKAYDLFFRYNQSTEIPIEIYKLKERYWRRTVAKDTRFRSHNQHSLPAMKLFFKRIKKIFSEVLKFEHRGFDFDLPVAQIISLRELEPKQARWFDSVWSKIGQLPRLIRIFLTAKHVASIIQIYYSCHKKGKF